MKVFLRDDHDEVLAVWRGLGVKDMDLIHVDAHMDFEVHPARTPTEVFKYATDIKQLRRTLEYTLAFLDYEKNLEKQTNIANYVYPAMRDHIVKNFWWVIPGDVASFEKNFKMIQRMYKNAFSGESIRLIKKGAGAAVCRTWDREFWVCVLEALPVFTKPVLLDIDCDFLVVDDLSRCDNTCRIGRRAPWILPVELKRRLLSKVKKPSVVTIVYSTTGGYTPMAYRHLGDELAYDFDPVKFAASYAHNATAAKRFGDFLRTGKKKDYRAAVCLNPAYRRDDNNYGQLYIAKNRLSDAEKELKKILKVDPANPAALTNMGIIFLQRRKYPRSLVYFKKALRCFKNDRHHKRAGIILGLALCHFKRGDFAAAERLFREHKRLTPLLPQSYYHLGRIYAARGDDALAAENYRHVLRLGVVSGDVLSRLYKVSLKLGMEEKKDIIRTIKLYGRILRHSGKSNKRLVETIALAEKSMQRRQHL